MPPHSISCRSILILSFHLCLGLPRGLFPFGFLTKTLYTSLLSPIRATSLAHLILDFITRTILGEENRSLVLRCTNVLSNFHTCYILQNVMVCTACYSRCNSYLHCESNRPGHACHINRLSIGMITVRQQLSVFKCICKWKHRFLTWHPVRSSTFRTTANNTWPAFGLHVTVPAVWTEHYHLCHGTR